MEPIPGRSVRVLGSIASATVATVLFVSVPTGAQSTADQILSPADIAELGLSSLEEVMQLAPAAPFAALGFSEPEQQVIRALTMPIDPPRYAFSDDQDGLPVIDPPGTDPIGIGSLQVLFEPGQLPVPGMEDRMYMVQQGDPTGGPTTLVWVEFDSAVDLTLDLAINEGGVFSRPSVEPWQSSFEADTWNGGNLFPTSTHDPERFELTMYGFEPPQTFPPVTDLPGFVMRLDNYLVIGVGTDALTAGDRLESIGYGFQMHHSPEPFTPGVISSYPPPRGRTPDSFPQVNPNEPLTPGTFCCYPETVDEQASAESSNSTTSSTTTSSTTTRATDSALQDDGDADGDSFGGWAPIIVIFGGLAIAVGGFWVHHQTRERDRPDGGPGEGEPPSGTHGGGDDRRDVAVPPPPLVSTCDWELHYWDGAQWEVLRPAAPGTHKCCTYRVRIETKVTHHDQTVEFRQDLGPERSYLPDFDFAWRGPDLGGHASTTSGPAGRRDWMHGLGDPVDQTTDSRDEAHWQQALGGEPPEVAVHLSHDEVTRIHVALESGCTDPANTYTSSGDSSLSVMTTHECTNDDTAPHCPVELSAFGWQFGDVWGELNWTVYDEESTDVDELERMMAVRRELDPEKRSESRLIVPTVRASGCHDHGVRDRITHDRGDFDAGADVKKDREWTTYVESSFVLDSGQLVPTHVRPTVERVSAHVEQQLKHSVGLSAEMKKGDCDATGCCTGNPGHECNCRPSFRLSVDGTASQIDVDGRAFRITRDPATADRHHPPVPAPPNYRAWQLV